MHYLWIISLGKVLLHTRITYFMCGFVFFIIIGGFDTKVLAQEYKPKVQQSATVQHVAQGSQTLQTSIGSEGDVLGRKKRSRRRRRMTARKKRGRYHRSRSRRRRRSSNRRSMVPQVMKTPIATTNNMVQSHL